MARTRILVVASAKADLSEIYAYVEANDSPDSAEKLLSGLEVAVGTLAELPERGHFPPELDRLGIREYREIHYKPYRIVYAVVRGAVVVHAVLDGRRDMQTLLQQRLIR